MANSGQFQKGQPSGNPAGRPKGAKGRWTAFKLLMEPHVPKVVEMLVDEAINERNMIAAKLILERVFPADAVKLEDQMDMLEDLQAQIDELQDGR